MKNINIGGKGVSDQCQQETFHDFNWKCTPKSEKDSVRQRYNKIIENIGGLGISDQCQH